MSRLTLQKRMEILEQQLLRLQDEVSSARSKQDKDWRRTIGVFTDDEGMKELLQQALRLREVNRKQARMKRPSKQRSSK